MQFSNISIVITISPCEILMSENYRYIVINDKSQGSVVTHLRCGDYV